MDTKILSAKGVSGRARPFNTPQKKPRRTWRTGLHQTSSPRAKPDDFDKEKVERVTCKTKRSLVRFNLKKTVLNQQR